MRRLVAGLAAAVLLTVGLSGCDRYADTNALGHCMQSASYKDPASGQTIIPPTNLTRWYRFAWLNGDWMYHCEGYLPFFYGFCIRWNTNYASQANPPHPPLNIQIYEDCGPV